MRLLWFSFDRTQVDWFEPSFLGRKISMCKESKLFCCRKFNRLSYSLDLINILRWLVMSASSWALRPMIAEPQLRKSLGGGMHRQRRGGIW